MQGIWMCRDKDMPVLVMDVEGTDGRERGENQVRLPCCAVAHRILNFCFLPGL